MAVDVGGTNIRFGRSETVSASLSDIQSFKCSDFGSIEEAVAAYVDSLKDMCGVNFDATDVTGHLKMDAGSKQAICEFKRSQEEFVFV